MFRNFLKDESAVTSIEYGLAAAVVSVAAIVALITLGDAPRESLILVETALITSLPAGGG